MTLLLLLLGALGCHAGDAQHNANPEVIFVRPAGTAYVVGEAIPFAAQVYDAERALSRLALAWTDADGTTYAIDDTPDEAGMLEGTLTLDTVGEHTITLSATDPAGNVGRASVSFSVGPNHLPECVILWPQTGSVLDYRGGNYLTGRVTDADVGPYFLHAVWSSSVNGELGEGEPSAQGTVGLFADLYAGEHELTLTATDPAGGACTDTVAVRVNAPPEAAIWSAADPAVYNVGESIELVGAVWDDHDAPEHLSCVLMDDSTGTVLDRPVPDSEGWVRWSTSSLPMGRYLVWLGAEDADGAVDWGYEEFRVNSLPGAPTVRIDGTNTLTATLVVASNDLERDTLTYAYAWTVDGVPFASNDPTIPAEATTSGQTWTVVVTPSDPYGTGEPGTASTLVP